MDFGLNRKIINKTPHNPNLASSQKVSSRYYSPERQTLVLNDFKNGFTVVDSTMLEFGLGIRGTLYFDNASGIQEQFYLSAAIIPVTGQEVISVRQVQTLEEAYSKSHFNHLPTDADALAAWNEGDSMSLEQRCGLIVPVSAGIPLVSFTHSMVAFGSWKFYIEKTGPQAAVLQISKGHIESVSQKVGNIFVSYGKGSYEFSDQGMRYSLDLTKDASWKAYKDLMNCNPHGIEALIAMDPQAGIQHDENMNSTRKGNFTNWYFGIPFILNTNWTTESTEGFEARDILVNNKRSEVHYGVHSHTRNTRYAFIRNRGRMVSFYGASYSMKDANLNQEERGQFGRLVWDYSSDDSSDGSLRRAMTELVQQTGMEKLLMMNIPSSQRLNYTGLYFEVGFSQDQTNRMIYKAQTQDVSAWQNQIQTAAQKYLASGQDPYGICARYRVSLDQGNNSSGNSLQANLANCLRTVQYGSISDEGSLKAISSMHQELLRMGATQGHDPKAFADAYAKFGKAMLENAFAFQKALELAGSAVELLYGVEGEQISAFELAAITTGTPGELLVLTSSDSGISRRNRHRSLEDHVTRGIIVSPNRPIFEGPLLPNY